MDEPTELRDVYDRLRVNGAELAYVDRGTGEPVVFVHGGLSDVNYLEPIAASFAEQFRAIAYSRRFAWPNPPLPDGAQDPIATHVTDLAGVLSGLAAAPAHVVGHSWGASVCLLLASKHPEVVRTLTLIEPEVFALFTGSPPSVGKILHLTVTRPRIAMTVIRAAADGQPIRNAYRRGEDQKAVRLAINWINGFDAFSELSPADRSHVLANVAYSRTGALAGPVKLSVEDARQVNSSTLLVVGERSPKFLHVFVAELKRLIKGAQVSVIPNASHGMISQNPRALEAAIRVFTSTNAGSGP